MGSYTIRAEQVPEVLHRIEVLNTRAMKLDLPRFQLEIGAPEYRTIDRGDTGLDPLRIEIVKVVITGEPLKLADWEFVATVEHTENGTILRRTPMGRDVPIDPQRWRTIMPRCDHCGLPRKRRDTYFVYHEPTQTLKQVGRSCLRDFTGHSDPEQLLALLEQFMLLITDLEGAIDDDYNPRGFMNGAPIRHALHVPTFLLHTAAVIRHHGWTPRSKADEYHPATIERVRSQIEREQKLTAHKLTVRDEYPIAIEEQDHILVRAALEWIRSMRNDDPETIDDYTQNLIVACASDEASDRNAGLICSLISAYNRYLRSREETARMVEQRSEAQLEHLPALVGDRIELKQITVMTVLGPYDNGYDRSYYKYICIDQVGHEIVWQTSKHLAKGMIWSGKATIKDKTVYVSKRHQLATLQTVITNVRGLVIE